MPQVPYAAGEELTAVLRAQALARNLLIEPSA
jgi:hypothetical protein